MRRIRNAALPALAAASLLVAAFAAGCGDDDGNAVSGNSTDRAFAGDMTPHHQHAVDMAALADENAEHAELKSLAEDIGAGQAAEIKTLKRIERELEADGVSRGDLGLDEHMMGMDMDMHALDSAKDFDRAFIDMMVPHHEGAIRMARIELKRGQSGEARRLASSIIAAQEREIRQMRSWRKAWYPESGKGGTSSGGGSSTDEGSGDHMMDH